MTDGIPPRLPTRTLDQGLVFLAPFFVEDIHLVVDLDQALDVERLGRALRLALDAEPVLGCRFVPRWWKPYWERLPAHRLDAPLLSASPADAGDEATDRFLAAALDPDDGPQVSALHVSRDGGARLVLKATHRCVDAGGTKAIAYRVADLYRRLGADAGHRPTPNFGSRSMGQVYRRLLPRGLWTLLRRHVADSWRNYVPWRSLTVKTGDLAEGPPWYRVRHYSGARLAAFDAFRRRHGATRNDLFFAAVLRAATRLADWNGRDVLRLVGTVDLRRYLPDGRAGGLCNLSGFAFPNLGRTLGDDLADTLVRMKAELDAAKAALPGLAFNLFSWLSFVGLPFGAVRRIIPALIRHQIRTGNLPPVITNMGPIDPDHLDFDGARATGAHLLVPAGRPGPFGLGMSGFGDTLTVSAGGFAPALPPVEAERFLDLFDEEWPT